MEDGIILSITWKTILQHPWIKEGSVTSMVRKAKRLCERVVRFQVLWDLSTLFLKRLVHVN